MILSDVSNTLLPRPNLMSPRPCHVNTTPWHPQPDRRISPGEAVAHNGSRTLLNCRRSGHEVKTDEPIGAGMVRCITLAGGIALGAALVAQAQQQPTTLPARINPRAGTDRCTTMAVGPKVRCNTRRWLVQIAADSCPPSSTVPSGYSWLKKTVILQSVSYPSYVSDDDV